MDIIAYFFVGVICTVFYGGIGVFIKPALLPFRPDGKTPSRLYVFGAWFGSLMTLSIIVSLFLVLSGKLNQDIADSNQMISLFIGIILSIWLWMYRYSKINKYYKNI